MRPFIRFQQPHSLAKYSQTGLEPDGYIAKILGSFYFSLRI